MAVFQTPCPSPTAAGDGCSGRSLQAGSCGLFSLRPFFLRRDNRPSANSPLENSGRAAGKGVEVGTATEPILPIVVLRGCWKRTASPRSFASEIEEIARRLCGDEKNALLCEQALVIAECDILISRVRAYSGELIASVKDTTALPTTKWRSELKQRREALYELFKKSDAVEASYDDVNNGGKTDSTELNRLWTAYFSYEADRDEGAAILVALPDLKRANRYEKRAWSRRRKAFLEFLRIKAETSNAKQPMVR